MTAQLTMIGDSMRTASALMRQATLRIVSLETALLRALAQMERTQSDSEGKWPEPDPGCLECTAGTVPDTHNRGLCAYHHAKKVLVNT